MVFCFPRILRRVRQLILKGDFNQKVLSELLFLHYHTSTVFARLHSKNLLETTFTTSRESVEFVQQGGPPWQYPRGSSASTQGSS